MFFVFAGRDLHPRGGANDCIGVEPSLEAAMDFCDWPDHPKWAWVHVATLISGRMTVVAQRLEGKWSTPDQPDFSLWFAGSPKGR